MHCRSPNWRGKACRSIDHLRVQPRLRYNRLHACHARRSPQRRFRSWAKPLPEAHLPLHRASRGQVLSSGSWHRVLGVSQIPPETAGPVRCRQPHPSHQSRLPEGVRPRPHRGGLPRGCLVSFLHPCCVGANYPGTFDPWTNRPFQRLRSKLPSSKRLTSERITSGKAPDVCSGLSRQTARRTSATPGSELPLS